ncbi:acetylcholine receptor subunit alpha-type acr-16 [Solenopsis invicta]|uniref:acetylcholine receptor subunit alpha-type acr-16 n=1 Tax=Solenopsis invicta TaxID=13686 RepID=UPI000596372E|nr:acetylcholine receptor subunit alpha-type acr-16 [Solenopsis invicta]
MRLSCTVYTTITLVLFSSIVLHANSIESFPVWNQTWTDRLKQDLFVKYDKFARPTEYFNTTGTKFGITPLFINVDDFKYTVTVTGMVRLSWIDEKLKWDPAKYGNITHINIGNHEVWQPDILLYNSGTSSTVKYYGDAPCLVYSNGNVLCVPPAKLIAYCELDFRLWPFDTQICDLKFGSWTYHSEQIDLQFFKEYEAEELMYVKSAEWTLINMSRIHEVKMYPCCAEPYTSLIYRMTLKRNSSLFCSILLMPVAAIIFLVLVPFWLPPQSEMKISIAAITILIISVLLGVFAFKVPFSVTPPLIVYFYSGCLCLETISLILSIVVINVSKRVYCKPFSRNIRLCLLSWPGKLLGLSDLISVIESRRSVPSQELRGKLTDESTTNATSTVSDNGDRQNVTTSTKDTTQLEWILVGTAIDRITFVLFCLILATMAIVCIR